MLRYFLAKTDPETYSISDLENDGTTQWDGVHNYQAINVIKSWEPGDYIFIYHSLGQAAIVGLAEVTGIPHLDEKDTRGISWCAEVTYIKSYPVEKQVTLKQVKECGLFSDFALVKQSRLSTMTCTSQFTHWALEKLEN